jgi:hypothetical protein
MPRSTSMIVAFFGDFLLGRSTFHVAIFIVGIGTSLGKQFPE